MIEVYKCRHCGQAILPQHGNRRYCNDKCYIKAKKDRNKIIYNKRKRYESIMRNDEILLAKRAFSPAKGEWGLPGGFMELNETLNEAAMRELKEETNLDGKVKNILSTCSHYGSIFGDILLIGVEMVVEDFSKMRAGDDAEELEFFSLNNLPEIAFDCHNKFISQYKNNL